MSKRYPSEEIVPALAHHNREVRRYAAMLLGVREDDQLVPFLADLLQSESVPARRAAAHALGTPTGSILAPNRAVWSAPTIDRLAVRSLTASLEDADAVVRANSARSLGELCRFADRGARYRDETDFDLLCSDDVALPLINALQDPVATVRIQAATSLNVLAVPAAHPVLIPLLQDPEREVRAAAAFAAAKLGARQSLPILLEILRDGPWDARRQAAASLRLVGDAEAVPALMEALADPIKSVQEDAAATLGHLGDPRAVPALMNALTATNIMAEERRALREDLFTALGQLGDRQAVPVIIPGLRDYEKNARAAAISALARLGGTEAEDALIGLVEKSIFGDEDDSVFSQVSHELATMGAVRAMPILRLMIEQGRQRLAPLAGRALHQLGDTVTAGDMVEWLNSSDCDLRVRAVRALPALVGLNAVPQLRHALADHHATVRATAAGKLGRVGDQSVVPFLTAALQDENEEVREAARSSLDAPLPNPEGAGLCRRARSRTRNEGGAKPAASAFACGNRPADNLRRPHPRSACSAPATSARMGTVSKAARDHVCKRWPLRSSVAASVAVGPRRFHCVRRRRWSATACRHQFGRRAN